MYPKKKQQTEDKILNPFNVFKILLYNIISSTFKNEPNFYSKVLLKNITGLLEIFDEMIRKTTNF